VSSANAVPVLPGLSSVIFISLLLRKSDHLLDNQCVQYFYARHAQAVVPGLKTRRFDQSKNKSLAGVDTKV
jgi:hypothetical protein